MNNTRLNDLPLIPVLGLTALIFSLSLIPRFFDIAMWLPQYWIDENDIVEPGIAFLGGDLNPRVHGYGPLYAYILALVNFIWMKFQGLDYLQYAGDIFFDPTRFYLIARITNSLLNILLPSLDSTLPAPFSVNRQRLSRYPYWHSRLRIFLPLSA